MRYAFPPHEYRAETLEAATESEVALPVLEIDYLLPHSLARNGWLLHVDEPLLVRGVEEARIDNRVGIQISENRGRQQPNRVNYFATNISEHEEPWAHVLIDPDPKPHYFLTRELNTAFWSGMLVTNAFMTEVAGAYRSEQERLLDISKKISTRVIPLIVLSNFIAMRLPQFSGEAFISMAQYVSAFAAQQSLNKRGNVGTAHYVSQKLKDQAVDLAIDYPVLLYEAHPEHSHEDIDTVEVARQRLIESLKRINRPSVFQGLHDILAWALTGKEINRQKRLEVARAIHDATVEAINYKPGETKINLEEESA